MRRVLLPFLFVCLMSSMSEARSTYPDNRNDCVDAKVVLPASQPDKSRSQKKKKAGNSKVKSIRKLRFAKPFMFLNPLISHLLFLSPAQQLNDSLGA